MSRAARGIAPALACVLALATAGPAVRPTRSAAAAPPTSVIRPAKGRFLVASRGLTDPNFAETVVLLLAYGGNGAMGVIVNRPTPARLSAVLPEVDALERRPDRLYLGGPVLPNALVLLVRAQKPPPDAQPVFADVHLVMTRQAVDRTLGSGLARSRLRAYAGHAGWAPGQLDAEIARGDWFVLPAEAALVFSNAPEAVWPRLVERGEGEWTRSPAPFAPYAPGSPSRRAMITFMISFEPA